MRFPIPKSAVPTIIVSATLSVVSPAGAAASSLPLRHTCPSLGPDLALKVTPIRNRVLGAFLHRSRSLVHVQSAGFFCTMATKKKRLSEWSFSPPTLSSLPTDAAANSTARRNVLGAVFSACRPTPLKEERRLIAVRFVGMKQRLRVGETLRHVDDVIVVDILP